MPFQYDVSAESELCHLQLVGWVDGADLVHAADQIYRDPRVHRNMNVLWDTSLVTRLVLDTNDFRRFREAIIQARGIDATGKGAIVVGRDSVVAAAEYFKATLRTKCRQIEVFYSMSGALEWLGASALPTASNG